MQTVANTLLSAHCPKGKVPQTLYRGAAGTLSWSRFIAILQSYAHGLDLMQTADVYSVSEVIIPNTKALTQSLPF